MSSTRPRSTSATHGHAKKNSPSPPSKLSQSSTVPLTQHLLFHVRRDFLTQLGLEELASLYSESMDTNATMLLDDTLRQLLSRLIERQRDDTQKHISRRSLAASLSAMVEDAVTKVYNQFYIPLTFPKPQHNYVKLLVRALDLFANDRTPTMRVFSHHEIAEKPNIFETTLDTFMPPLRSRAIDVVVARVGTTNVTLYRSDVHACVFVRATASLATLRTSSTSCYNELDSLHSRWLYGDTTVPRLAAYVLALGADTSCDETAFKWCNALFTEHLCEGFFLMSGLTMVSSRYTVTVPRHNRCVVLAWTSSLASLLGLRPLAPSAAPSVLYAMPDENADVFACLVASIAMRAAPTTPLEPSLYARVMRLDWHVRLITVPCEYDAATAAKC